MITDVLNEPLVNIQNNILSIHENDYIKCIKICNGMVHHDGHLIDNDNNHYCFNKWYHKNTSPYNISYKYKNDNILSVIQVWNNLFQHITFDTLPKIPFIEKLLKTHTFKILCMNETQKNMIKNISNIPDDLLLICEKNTSYLTNNAYYLNFYNSNNLTTCMGSCGSNILSNYIPEPLSGKKNVVYISRGTNTMRSVINENEIIKAINNFCINNEYIFKLFINPSGLSSNLKEALQNSYIVISPHGGALGNMIYCNKKTNIIEFISLSKLEERPCFYYLSQALGLNYYNIEPVNFNFDSKMEVSITKIIEKMNLIIYIKPSL